MHCVLIVPHWFTNCVFFCSICCGSLEYYDKTYDRVNVKNEKPLQRIDRIFHTVTTTDDPVIRKLSKTEGNVYATDAILATLMCCTRSNYSWDIVIEKIGDKLFLDKRDNTEFGNLQSHYFIWQLSLATSSQLNCCINLLKTKRNLLYIRNETYRTVNTFHHGYKNQSVNDVQSKSRCLFWDTYKTINAKRAPCRILEC